MLEILVIYLEIEKEIRKCLETDKSLILEEKPILNPMMSIFFIFRDKPKTRHSLHFNTQKFNVVALEIEENQLLIHVSSPNYRSFSRIIPTCVVDLNDPMFFEITVQTIITRVKYNLNIKE